MSHVVLSQPATFHAILVCTHGSFFLTRAYLFKISWSLVYPFRYSRSPVDSLAQEFKWPAIFFSRTVTKMKTRENTIQTRMNQVYYSTRVDGLQSGKEIIPRTLSGERVTLWFMCRERKFLNVFRVPPKMEGTNFLTTVSVGSSFVPLPSNCLLHSEM